MKIKFNIDENLPEEKAEFWLKKMTTKIERIAGELNSKQDYLWCYKEDEAFPIKFDDIYLIQVENNKTLVYTQEQTYFFKGRLYQVKELLPYEFIEASRSALINYHKIDHLEMIDNGNIDVILENKQRVQIARRKIKNLKERLGL